MRSRVNSSTNKSTFWFLIKPTSELIHEATLPGELDWRMGSQGFYAKIIIIYRGVNLFRSWILLVFGYYRRIVLMVWMNPARQQLITRRKIDSQLAILKCKSPCPHTKLLIPYLVLRHTLINYKLIIIKRKKKINHSENQTYRSR